MLSARQLELFNFSGQPTPRALAAVPQLPERPPREEVITRAADMAHQLSADLGTRVRLFITDNRSTMISFRRRSEVLWLRLHHMFLRAPAQVIRAVADYAGRGNRSAGLELDVFIAEHGGRIRHLPKPAEVLEVQGRCFDLKDIFERLNVAHFQGGIRARIGWGRQAPRRRRRSIRLGVYDHQTREIRIHPALDSPDVPLFFVEYIVFHEMLHQLFPSARMGSRHVHHPKAFRAREKAFVHYCVAVEWEKEHLGKLLKR